MVLIEPEKKARIIRESRRGGGGSAEGEESWHGLGAPKFQRLPAFFPSATSQRSGQPFTRSTGIFCPFQPTEQPTCIHSVPDSWLPSIVLRADLPSLCAAAEINLMPS